MCPYENPAPTPDLVRGCTYFLETHYADCDAFCGANGLTCVAATKNYMPSHANGTLGCDNRGSETPISCSDNGKYVVRFNL